MSEFNLLLHVLNEKARSLRSTLATLEKASKQISKTANKDKNIHLQSLARALLPLGFCVVHKDALEHAIDAMDFTEAVENDITDDSVIAAYNKARDHLKAALHGF